MKQKRRKHIYLMIILILMAIISITGPGRIKDAVAYYGLSSMYGYGNGLLNSLSNPFGFGGIYNLTTSLGGYGLLGGLYGTSSLYGLGGMGGLYGLGSLYGLGGGLYGLYGMSGLYGLGGLGGLYGMGSLYGLSSLYGLGGMGGLYGLGSLYGLGGGLYGLGGLYGMGGFYGLGSLNLSGLSSLLPGLITDPVSTNNPLVAEQAGTWIGQWNLGFLFGTMVLNLKEDPLTGALSGTAQLIGNNTFPGIFNVYGTGTPSFVQLTGQDPLVSYAITLTAPLPTPTTMEGYYDIYKVTNSTPIESGTFSLELVSAVVI